MSGRSLSDEFRDEHATFWSLMEQVIHGLRNNYPAMQDDIIGRMGQLNLQLSILRRAGEMMGSSYPPSEIVRDAPLLYFTGRAQRHQNYFGTEFGYSCWYTQAQVGYTIADLLNQRDHTRVADHLEQLSTIWTLTDMRVFPGRRLTRNPVQHPITLVRVDGPPYYTTGGPGAYIQTARISGPVRTHPHIRLPALADTTHGVARQTRHRAVQHPGRGFRRVPRGHTRLTPTMPRVAVLLPGMMPSGDASHLPQPILSNIQSLSAPQTLAGGVTLPGVPATSVPPPRGIQIPPTVPAAAPDTAATISVLNANIRGTLHGGLDPWLGI